MPPKRLGTSGNDSTVGQILFHVTYNENKVDRLITVHPEVILFRGYVRIVHIHVSHLSRKRHEVPGRAQESARLI
jgi:hypothetical protein